MNKPAVNLGFSDLKDFIPHIRDLDDLLDIQEIFSRELDIEIINKYVYRYMQETCILNRVEETRALLHILGVFKKDDNFTQT